MLLKHTKQLRLLRADLERDFKELAPSSTGSGREEERISIAVDAPKGLTPHNFRERAFIEFNRKDDMQCEFVAKASGLKRVSLSQLFVPSLEGQVRAVLAGWGGSQELT